MLAPAHLRACYIIFQLHSSGWYSILIILVVFLYCWQISKHCYPDDGTRVQFIGENGEASLVFGGVWCSLSLLILFVSG